MRRKISNAPRPLVHLPPSHGEPEAQAKPKAKHLPEATSVAALQFHTQFRKAIRGRNRADAKFYAQKCRDEGLPEPWLTEVFHLLDRLLGNRHAPAQKRDPGPKTTVRSDLEEAMRKISATALSD